MTQALRIALIIAAALIAAGIANGGIYTIAAGSAENNPQGGTVFVINRFTGTVSLCTPVVCREPHSATAAQ